MISSISAMALAPAHPPAAEHQPAAIDKGHPQVEPVADQEVSRQRQCADAKADHDKGVSEPESGDDVEQHEIDRPERAHLARREVAEHAGAEKTKGEEQHERDQGPEIEGANACLAISEGADRKRSRDARDIQRGPEIAGLARQQKRGEIAGKYQRTPHDHHQAGEIVDPRLPDAARHLVDFGERLGCLAAVDHVAHRRYDPAMARVATSSATMDIAFGAATIPMWLMPPSTLTSTATFAPRTA